MKWGLLKSLVLLLFILLTITGCKDRTTSFDPDDDPTLVESSFGEATLGENTTVIPEETLDKLASVSEDGAVFTFSSGDPALDNLQEGSIMVMGISPHTPMGALRKVDNIEKIKGRAQNNGVIIRTIETVIEEAFENLEESETIELDPTQVDSIIYKVPSLGIRSKMTNKTHPKLADFAFSLPFEQIFYQDPGNSEAHLKLSGKINLSPSIKLDLRISEHQLQYVQFLMINELDTDLIVTSKISREIEKEFIIFQYWFQPVFVGPVVVTPIFNIPLGVEGLTNIGIQPELNVRIISSAGIQYESTTWEPIAKVDTIDFSAQMPIVDVNASLKGYVGPEFDLFLYGIAGPYATLQGYGEATADVNRNPQLQIFGGVEAKVGVKMRILSKTIASHEFPELFSWRNLIYEAGGDTDGTVTDIDGNEYKTVIIGRQEWMAANLMTTRYRNGDDIPTNLSNNQWSNTTLGAMAVYSHGEVDGISSEEGMVAAYGRLYNWYAITDSRGVCPAGWRVPSDGDWTQLTDYIGILNGDKLKSRRQVNSPLGAPWATDEHPRWNSNDTHYGTDNFGFAGLPGGYRRDDGNFANIGHEGGWWKSTEGARGLDHLNGLVYWVDYGKSAGLSIRCLRD